jgi:predicted CXXCH cytochrome family protein
MTRRREKHLKMLVRAGRRMLVILVIATSIAGVVIGCSTDTRYRIKTIIFTGVPPLHEEGTPNEAVAVDPREAARAEQLARQERHSEALISKYWQHGPFAANECWRCHNLSQSKSFLGTREPAIETAGPMRSVTGPSRLLMQPHELCATCHTQHGARYVRNRGLQQHRPAEVGTCTDCHHPHQSLRQYMLLKTDNRELCGGCHELMDLSPVHTEVPEQDCIACHNAHVGVTSKLLSSDAEDLALLYGGDNE